MPSDVEHELLEQQLLSIYHDIVAGPSTSGDFLMKRLASELYARGVRATIGAVTPTKEVVLHHSLDPDQRLVWVSKLWNQIMGYRARQAIGLHVSSIISPESYNTALPEIWSSVVMAGKSPSRDVTLVTARGELLSAKLSTEALRDSDGLFQRTFARIKLRVPLVMLPLLFAACSTFGGQAVSTDLARRLPPRARPAPEAPVKRKGVFRRPKVYASRGTTSVPLEMMAARPGAVNATSPTTSSPDFTSNATSRELPA